MNKINLPIGVLLAILLSVTNLANAQTTLIPYGASWKYLDNGTDQGTAWTGTSFNDGSWATGNAELGYGDGDEATVVSYGSSSLSKHITTYFRKNINISNASLYNYYNLNIKRDDGAVVYVNGVEVFRTNMPSGSITFNTKASGNASDNGTIPQTVIVPSNTFVNGNNIVAVEMHQFNGLSSDLSFDLELIGNPSPVATNIVKGPYLQVATPTSIIIKWETTTPTSSKVTYGTTLGSLTSFVQDTTTTVNHELKLTGLTPYTSYYYSIGALQGVLQSGADNHFLTSPLQGTPGKYRFWAVGDCGDGSTLQTAVKDQYLQYTGNRVTNGWLLLGDNAYISGLNSEYNSKFFNKYQSDVTKNIPIWPTPGNHEYNNFPLLQVTKNIPYYDIFRMPTQGEAGGVPSSSSSYYSFNYGNVHFISLDSYGIENVTQRLSDTLSPQAIWLKQDLAANHQLWTVVFFHHCPYTMGSHNSDTESELEKIREKLVPILERFSVDLVLCGHSHVYERSKLMKGHYGLEPTFDPLLHNVSNSSGSYNSISSCPYVKDSIGSLKGTVYVVSGSGSKVNTTSEAAWPHNGMHYSNNTNGGSVILDFDHNRSDLKWLCEDGVVRDQYTMFKNVNKKKVYNVLPNQPLQLTASWPGSYVWSNTTDTSRTLNYVASINTTIVVSDKYNCVADTFYINTGVTTIKNGVVDKIATSIYPNPTTNDFAIEFTLVKKENISITLVDMLGKTNKLFNNKLIPAGKQTIAISANDYKLMPGIYTVVMEAEKEIVSRAIVVIN